MREDKKDGDVTDDDDDESFVDCPIKKKKLEQTNFKQHSAIINNLVNFLV